MADFNNLALTFRGIKALLEAQAGNMLTLSKIGLGSGTTNGSIVELTSMAAPEVLLPISEKIVESESGYLTLVAKMTNESVTEGFYWRETGLFYEDSEGNDVLFAYACVSSDDKYDYVPAYSDQRYLKHVRIANVVSDGADITIKENDGLLYVDVLTYEEFLEEYGEHVKKFEEHISDQKNPHKVTKSQVGLDLVPNVSTNDQTPTYTAATTLTALASGELLSTAFGKIAKAIKDLILHLANKSNPHGVTATQVGALTSGDVVDNLASTSSKLPLSSNQGRELNASLEKLKKFFPAYATTNKLFPDALYADFSSPFGTDNEVGYVVAGSTEHLPTGCVFGIRELYWYNSTHNIVKITGITTTNSLNVWYAFYNGTWNGWYNTSFESRDIGSSSVDDLYGDSFQGRYFINGSTVAGTHPTKDYYTLIAFTNAQLALPYSGDGIYYRTFVNSVWTAWRTAGEPVEATYTPINGTIAYADVFISNGIVFFSISTNCSIILGAGKQSQIGTFSKKPAKTIEIPCSYNAESIGGLITIDTDGNVKFRPRDDVNYNAGTSIVFNGNYRTA